MLKKKKKPLKIRQKTKKTKEKVTKSKDRASKITKKEKITKEKTTKEKVGLLRKIITFLKETKSELKKVVWPNKKEVLIGTIVVITMITIVALYVVFSDFIFRNLFRTLINVIKVKS